MGFWVFDMLVEAIYPESRMIYAGFEHAWGWYVPRDSCDLSHLLEISGKMSILFHVPIMAAWTVF